MPADRGLADTHGDEIRARFGTLDRALIFGLSRRLRQILGQRLPADTDAYPIAQALVRQLRGDVVDLAWSAVRGAAVTGQQAAAEELAALGLDTAAERLDVAGAVLDLAVTLEGTFPRVLRWAADAFRLLAVEVEREAGGTRLQVAQRAWSRITARGVTGFRDRAGRDWALTSYVEMATRSRLARVAVDAHLQQLGAAGLDLVQVSDAPQECALCRPWEAKVLTREGAPGARTVDVEHALIDDETVRVVVAGSVAEALLAGLMHPNCRHSLSGYLPGVTTLPTRTADPEGDKARQQQRGLERRIRAAKTQQAAALTAAAKREATARLRAAQSTLITHLDAHPELRRLPKREQIGAGNLPPAPRARRAEPDPLPPTLPAVRSADPDTGRLEPLRIRVPAEPKPFDPATLTDEQLETAVAEHADNEERLLVILAELERRDQAGQAEPGDEPPDPRWEQVDALVAEGWSDEDAYAEVFEKDAERLRRDDAIRRLREDGYAGRGFDELARAAYRDALQHDYFAAEAATNGFLLSRVGQAQGIDPRKLWTGNEAFARKWASDELREWWDQHGRLSFEEFAQRLLTGGAAERFRTGGESFLR